MTAKIISLPIRTRSIPGNGSTEETTRQELRRARIRIAQLEASLTEAMRDSLKHFNRAREAEEALFELS